MPPLRKIRPLKNPVAVTANQVLKGHTVYLMANGDWSKDVKDAAIANDREQETVLLKTAETRVNSQYILGVYAFDIELIDGKATPITMREKIRARHEPTIIPDGLTAKPEWENQFTITNANSHTV